MSINFDDPMNDEARKLIIKKFKDVAAMDETTALLDKLEEINQSDMKEIANTAKQPVSVEINEPGDIKTMSDGTKYRCTNKGWRLITDENT